MLQLRAFAEDDLLRGLGTWLESSGQGRHVITIPQAQSVHGGLLMADVERESVDEVLEHLSAAGVAPENISFLNIEAISPGPADVRARSLIWADMVGMARRYSRPLARYLVFMVVAGIIAGYGVLTINDTLILGAMAVSPDTLPVVAACVGIVGRQWPLASRSVGTLALGMAVTALAAGLTAAV